MKKIYTFIASALFVFASQAQLTLTKAFNEPIIGNVAHQLPFDSSSAMNHSMGSNQVWNYTALTTTANMVNTTYTTPSSCSGYVSGFSSATIGSNDGTASQFYKATATQYELVGMVPSSTITLTFTNSAIVAVWPITSTYSMSDSFGGTASATFSSFPVSGPISGNQTVTATGTGTLNLPYSISMPNCMQLKTSLVGTGSVSLFTLTANFTLTTVSYAYYNASQKFPILTINYSTTTFKQGSSAAQSTSVTSISINNDVFTGVQEIAANDLFSIYPNPTSGKLNINVDNANGEATLVEIKNLTGQTLKSFESPKNSEPINGIDLSDLSKGIYFIRTSVGERTSTRKIILD